MAKLHSSQRKVMLNMLGIPMREIPKSIGEVDSLLSAFMSKDSTEYRKVFDIVVNHKLPDGATAVERGYQAVGVLIDEELSPALSKFEQKMDHIYKQATVHAKSSYEEIGRRMATFADLNTELKKDLKRSVDVEIKKAAETYKKVEVCVGKTKPVKIEKTVPAEFQKILDLCANRINTLLVGPSGSGKTYLASVVAESLGLDFSSQSCSAGMSESLLTGWLLPIGESGEFKYVPSEFVRIYENGGVFLFDEIDASDPNVLIFINAALSGDSFHIPQRFENPKIKRHKDFVAIAAANTNGGGATSMYSARNKLDGATLDRFRTGVVTVDYNETVENAIGDADVVAFARKMREVISSKKLKKIVSTRFIKDATKMKLSAGWSMKEIYKSFVADWSEEELRVCNLPHAVDRFLVDECHDIISTFLEQEGEEI